MRNILRNITLLALALLFIAPMMARGGKNVVVSEENRRKAEYIFLEGQNQKQQGNNAAFYDLIRYAHRLDPTNTAIAYYYGYCLLAMHDVEKADFEQGLKLMRAHVDAQPADNDEAMLYSDACMAVGQVQEGMRVIKRAAKLNPGKVDVQIILANGYAQLGEFKNAIAVYDSIEVLEGKSVILAGKKVRAYQAMNDTVGALREMRSLLSTAPRNADFNIAMANMFQMFGQGDSAIVYLDKAQEFEPENGNTYMAKAQYYNMIGDSVAYDQQIYQALTSKDLEVSSKEQVLADYARHLLIARDSSQRVVNLFDVLLGQHPHEPTIRSLYSEYLVARQDYKGAAEQLGYQLDLDPTDSKAWHKLMLVNMMGGDYQAAVNAANKSIELNPDSIELYRYIAPAYYEMKEYDKAISIYNQALEKCDTNDIETRSGLIGGKGDVYYALGDTVKAFDAYEQALDIFPENVSIMNNYAYFLAECNRELDKAERMSALAVKAEPQNATFIDTYAWVFFKKKDYGMALFYIESAIDKDSSGSADLLDHYGDILYFNNQQEKAVEQWTKALQSMPDNERLQRKVNDKKYYEK